MKHSPQILKKTALCLMTLCLLLIASCEKNHTTSDLENEINITLYLSSTEISLETKSTPSPIDIAENKINRVRVYAFNQANNTLINMVYQELDIAAQATTQFTMVLTGSAEIKLYAIINEPKDQTIQTLLAGVTDSTQLNTIKYQISHYFNSNAGGIFTHGATTNLDFCLPMTGEKTIRTTLNSTTTIDIPITRCVSRVDVYLRKDADLPVQILPTTTFNIQNTVATSFLLDGTRQDEANESEIVERSCVGENIINIPKKTEIADKSDYTKAFWFYSPERLHSAKKMTYTITGIQYENTMLTTNPVPLLANVSSISRNNIYKVYCTIGERIVSIDNTGITNWMETEISGDIKKPETFTIEKDILMDWWANGKTFVKAIPYSTNQDVKLYIGDTITVATPNSNLNDGFPWVESAIWTKTDNRNGSITIKYKVDNTPQKEAFVIKIESEDITYILNVIYDNGYIPPEELPDMRNTWATDGLHLAKIGFTGEGNSAIPIAPSQEKSDLGDWLGPINSNNKRTTNVEKNLASAKYGGGIKNTTRMVNANDDPESDAYRQAAHYCRRLGAEWYIPNSIEFEYIFNNLKTSFGPSYTFTNTYWCSSHHEVGKKLQSTISSSNNDILGKSINSEFYVRCIRDI